MVRYYAHVMNHAPMDKLAFISMVKLVFVVLLKRMEKHAPTKHTVFLTGSDSDTKCMSIGKMGEYCDSQADCVGGLEIPSGYCESGICKDFSTLTGCSSCTNVHVEAMNVLIHV